MYANVSEQFKKSVSGRAITPIGRLTFKDFFSNNNVTSDLVLQGSDITQNGIKISDYCYNNGQLIGTAMTKEAEIEIKNAEGYDLADKTFDLEIGVDTSEEVLRGPEGINVNVDIPEGNSTQFTTTGKNLCKLVGTPITGVTFEDSEISITGTYSSNKWQPFNRITLPAGTYTLSFEADFEITSNTYFLFNGQATPFTLKRLTITIAEQTDVGLGLVISQGTYNNNYIKVQIEAGSFKTDYEPYTGRKCKSKFFISTRNTQHRR